MLIRKTVCLIALLWPLTAWSALPLNGRIVAFEGTEGLSQPYRFEVEITGNSVDALLPLIDTAVSFPLPGGQQIGGILREVYALGMQRRSMGYRLVIEPRLADAAQARRYRSFVEMTSTDVISDLLSELGQNFEMNVTGDPVQWPLITQYDESDLDFMHRLMERDGLFYYFEHGENSHTMIITDRSTNAPEIPAPLNAAGERANLQRLEFGIGKSAGTVQRNNFNFETPNASLAAQAQGARFTQIINEEVRAQHTELAQGQVTAAQQLQAQTALAAVVTGRSTAGIVSGHRVEVAGLAHREANQQYLITDVEHSFNRGRYRNSFNAIPASLPYRTPISTPTPRASVTRAFVAGPAGEEIDVDEHGRVRVSFIWSRPGQETRVRVVQPNADSLWFPRIGEEVLVGFVNDDPSRPLVLGSLFNADARPPYPLPESKTVLRLAASSSPGGQGVNEIMLGNTAGSELMRLSAAKDLTTVAANDRRESVGNNQLLTVSEDRRVTVGGNQATSISGSAQTSIRGDARMSANTLLIEGSDQIVLRVGNQQLVIDSNGVRLPPSSSSSNQTSAPPVRTTAPTAPSRRTATPIRRPPPS